MSTAGKDQPETTGTDGTKSGQESWNVERGRGGSILVRVPSKPVNGRPLPDAVFTFRRGDPQYEYWEEQLRRAESRGG